MSVINKGFIAMLIVMLIIAGGIYGFLDEQNEVQREIKESTRLVMGNEVIKNIDKVIIDNNEIYVPVEFIKEYIDKNVNMSDDGKRLFIDLTGKEFELENHKITELVKENNVIMNILLRYENGIKYIPLASLSKIFNVNVDYIEDSGVVVVDRFSDEVVIGRVKSDKAKVKTYHSNKSFTLDKLSQGDEVRVFGENDNWYEIRTHKGYIGYIEKENIDRYVEKLDWSNKINEVRENHNEDEIINITWEYVYERTPDITNEERIEGLDIVCPTWFSLSEDGIILNNGDFNYVKEAHGKGYKIWGLVNNSFDPELTTQMINSNKLKNRFIAQLVFYASLYDLDGINIDFENIYYEDKDAFASFVEELSDVFKNQNLTLSIDVTVPGGSKRWSQVYDRERLAKAVDYVALMAYDEHWATSPVSGSVASLGWVERGIVGSLEAIPKEKLLLGIPFYTRIWKESTDEKGNITVTSKAVPIKYIEEILAENDAEIVWDKSCGQYFATYMVDGDVYKIWIEDDKSIELKLKLAQKYGLKGIASWRKGFEYEEIWEVIRNTMEGKKLL